MTMGATVLGHTKQVNLLALSPDSYYLISGASGVQLIMWTWSTMSLSQVKVFIMSEMVFGGRFIPTAFTGMIICNILMKKFQN
jgi:WD40 repeat protein